MAYSTHYKSISERKGNNQLRGKPYNAPANKRKQRVTYEKKPSKIETPASVKCFKCGDLGHRANECENNVLRCFKYGKISMGQHWLCLNFPLTIYDKSFGMDLVYLSLRKISMLSLE